MSLNVSLSHYILLPVAGADKRCFAFVIKVHNQLTTGKKDYLNNLGGPDLVS